MTANRRSYGRPHLTYLSVIEPDSSPRQSTKTQQGRPRTPQRQPPRPRRALPGHQEGGV